MPQPRMLGVLLVALLAAASVFVFVGWQYDQAHGPKPRPYDYVGDLARNCVSENPPAAAVMDGCFQRVANQLLAEQQSASRVVRARCVQPDTGQYECLATTLGPRGARCYSVDVTYTHLSNSNEYANVNWLPPEQADGCPGVRAK